MFAVKSAAAAAVLFLPAPAAAEPATADPTFLPLDGRIVEPKTLTQFRFAGASCSLAAKGRRAAIDTNLRRDDFLQTRAMSKVLPGYPQPPLMVMEIHLWF